MSVRGFIKSSGRGIARGKGDSMVPHLGDGVGVGSGGDTA